MGMTYDEQTQYYANLLVQQYRRKPKAQATILLLAGLAMQNNLPLAVRDAYNIDPDLGAVAVGKQLDVIGNIVGVKRDALVVKGGEELTDLDFLTLIRLRIVLNSATSSLKDIDDLLLQYMGNALIAFDNENMSMSYFFNSSLGSPALARAFVELGMLPRPMGVQLSSLVYGGGLENAYGWGTYDSPPAAGVTGLNDYDNFNASSPYITYDDSIIL